MEKVKQLPALLNYILRHPMNVDRKMSSFLRFLGWQIGSRLVPGPVAIQFVNDSRLLVGSGHGGATGNIYCGVQDFEEMSFLLHLLRPDDLFVDVGANIGSYTVLAGAAVGAKCLALEPIPSTFRCLVQNVRLNGIDHITRCLRFGIGRVNGILSFTQNLDFKNHVKISDDDVEDTIQVPIRTLDDLVGEQRPTLIKIDVEGYESDVIAGAEQVLSKDSLFAVIIELIGQGKKYGFDEGKVNDRLMDHGFKMYSYFPLTRELRLTNNYNHYSLNSLYVKNVETVIERLRTAPPFVSNGKTI